MCSHTQLDQAVCCISEHIAVSLLSTPCSITLRHIKLPILNTFCVTYYLHTINFCNLPICRSISNRPINKAANNVMYIKQSSGGGILKEMVLYSAGTYYEDVHIARH